MLGWKEKFIKKLIFVDEVRKDFDDCYKVLMSEDIFTDSEKVIVDKLYRQGVPKRVLAEELGIPDTKITSITNKFFNRVCARQDIYRYLFRDGVEVFNIKKALKEEILRNKEELLKDEKIMESRRLAKYCDLAKYLTGVNNSISKYANDELLEERDRVELGSLVVDIDYFLKRVKDKDEEDGVFISDVNNKYLDVTIDCFGLSGRVYIRYANYGFRRVSDFVGLTRDDLMRKLCTTNSDFEELKVILLACGLGYV